MLNDSDYSGITIRNLLDMATGINCPEEYFDKKSCYYQYSITVGDGYWDDSSPNSPYEMLASLKPVLRLRRVCCINILGLMHFY